ncbi:MAG: hypothetical protein ACFFA0_05685 [Promethearchaeota archaeon]
MSNFVKEFKFKSPPQSLKYIEGEPLKLTEKFCFFHNKSTIRKNLNTLQYLFKSYLNNPLLATGIRDSYLKEEFTEKYLIVLFTTSDIVKNTNKIIEHYSDIDLNQNCFLLEVTTEYILLLAKDVDGIAFGIDTIEDILKQVMEDYFSQKNFDDYLKIPTFRLSNCIKS